MTNTDTTIPTRGVQGLRMFHTYRDGRHVGYLAIRDEGDDVAVGDGSSEAAAVDSLMYVHRDFERYEEFTCPWERALAYSGVDGEDLEYVEVPASYGVRLGDPAVELRPSASYNAA